MASAATSPSFCVWTPKKDIPAAIVGTLALAALVTGIALAILHNPNALNISLMAGGGTFLGAALIFSLITKYNDAQRRSETHRRAEAFRQEVQGTLDGFVPLEIPHEMGKKLIEDRSERSSDTTNRDYAAMLVHNWDCVKDKKPNWLVNDEQSGKIRWPMNKLAVALSLTTDQLRFMFIANSEWSSVQEELMALDHFNSPSTGYVQTVIDKIKQRYGLS